MNQPLLSPDRLWTLSQSLQWPVKGPLLLALCLLAIFILMGGIKGHPVWKAVAKSTLYFGCAALICLVVVFAFQKSILKVDDFTPDHLQSVVQQIPLAVKILLGLILIVFVVYLIIFVFSVLLFIGLTIILNGVASLIFFYLFGSEVCVLAAGAFTILSSSVTISLISKLNRRVLTAPTSDTPPPEYTPEEEPRISEEERRHRELISAIENIGKKKDKSV